MKIKHFLKKKMPQRKKSVSGDQINRKWVSGDQESRGQDNRESEYQDFLARKGIRA